MSQVHKMTGASWHIEEHYDTKSYARNCVNCVCFQKEGRMCRKENEHVSFNFARYCKHFENINPPAINMEKEDCDFEEPVIKKEPISSIFLIKTKKRWNRKYIQMKSLIRIYCGRIQDKNKLESMKKTSYIICYDGFVAYKVKVIFSKIENNQLHFKVRNIYEYHIPGYLRLNDSKTKTVVDDRTYDSVAFVQERVGH